MNLLKASQALNLSGYIQTQLVNSNIINSIKLLNLGERFSETIKNIWLKTNNSDNLCFSDKSFTHIKDDKQILSFIETPFFQEKFSNIKSKYNELPIILKFEHEIKNSIQSTLKFSTENFVRNDLLLSTYFFCNESSVIEKFYNIQRERKIWWMKLSTKPSRYSLTEFKTTKIKNSTIQSVEINANFDFCHITFEKIQLMPSQLLPGGDFLFEDKSLGISALPAVIKSEISLNAAVLGLLYDACENSNNLKLSLHRSIAPYQCGIMSFSSESELLADFKNLTNHLQNVVSNAGVVVFIPVESHKSSLEKLEHEYKQLDLMGVPYIITITQSSLKNGIIKLRNRDTTLSESIHISDLSYLKKIFKPKLV